MIFFILIQRRDFPLYAIITFVFRHQRTPSSPEQPTKKSADFEEQRVHLFPIFWPVSPSSTLIFEFLFTIYCDYFPSTHPSTTISTATIIKPLTTLHSNNSFFFFSFISSGRHYHSLTHFFFLNNPSIMVSIDPLSSPLLSFALKEEGVPLTDKRLPYRTGNSTFSFENLRFNTANHHRKVQQTTQQWWAVKGRKGKWRKAAMNNGNCWPNVVLFYYYLCFAVVIMAAVILCSADQLLPSPHTHNWLAITFLWMCLVFFCCYLISFFITIIISGNLGGQRAQRAKVWMISQNIFNKLVIKQIFVCNIAKTSFLLIWKKTKKTNKF